MKCMITGGAGFIGSHIADTLLKKGHQVRILDNFYSGSRSNLDHVKGKVDIVEGDIRDKKSVEKAMDGVDFVFHEAALKLVPESFKNPTEYNEVNVEGTLLLLEEALRQKVKKFVYASSSSSYGANEKLPKEETDYVEPISPYAITKLAGEQYCQTFTRTYNMPSCSLRYFNVFGPRQPLNDGYSNVIPKFISCILNNEPPPVYGDGTQSRDFTHISNVVQANILSMEKTSVSGVFNVGMGERHDLLTVIDLLNGFLGKNIKPAFLPPQKGDVKHTLASIKLIQEKLGYQSTLTFKQGLKETLEWFRVSSRTK